MSALAHIKEEILELTSADRREVEVFLRELAQREQAREQEALPSRRQRFEDAKSHLFTHYGDLLEKLAQ